jgi:hypothetical protein
MKSIKRLIFASILMIALALVTMSVSATDATLTVGVVAQENSIATEAQERAVVTYGLCVIVEQNKMTLTGITGKMLNFSPERFACALNLSQVDSPDFSDIDNENIKTITAIANTYSYGALIYMSEKFIEIERLVNFNLNVNAVTDGILFGILEGKHKWQK